MIPAGSADSARDVATVNVSYANMQTGTTDRLSSTVAARFTGSGHLVEKETNPEVMVEAVKHVANDRAALALSLRDKGQVKEARELFGRNNDELKRLGKKYDSKDLQEQADLNFYYRDNLSKEKWKETRKKARRDDYSIRYQQKWK
ncbi:hypothetical protein ACFL01_00990 [Planctomycetota bacterium]